MFERGALNQAHVGEKRWRGPIRKVSIADMVKELSQFLGNLQNIRKLLTPVATLNSTLSDRKYVIGYMDWHSKEKCNGEEREYHQNTLRQLATLLDWLEGDGNAVASYQQLAEQLIPVRVKDLFPSRPIQYDEMLQAASRALQENRDRFDCAH